jgi:hypothetical protein
MSGERPVPLWPEGISKVRPIGKQRTEALPTGVSAPVARQQELSNPTEQPVPQQSKASAETNAAGSETKPPVQQKQSTSNSEQQSGDPNATNEELEALLHSAFVLEQPPIPPWLRRRSRSRRKPQE